MLTSKKSLCEQNDKARYFPKFPQQFTKFQVWIHHGNFPVRMGLIPLSSHGVGDIPPDEGMSLSKECCQSECPWLLTQKDVRLIHFVGLVKVELRWTNKSPWKISSFLVSHHQNGGFSSRLCWLITESNSWWLAGGVPKPEFFKEGMVTVCIYIYTVHMHTYMPC